MMAENAKLKADLLAAKSRSKANGSTAVAAPSTVDDGSAGRSSTAGSKVKSATRIRLEAAVAKKEEELRRLREEKSAARSRSAATSVRKRELHALMEKALQVRQRHRLVPVHVAALIVWGP
jgi:hypothetical protein